MRAVFPVEGAAGRSDAGVGDERANGGAFAVFALEDGRARLRRVEVAARNGSEAWIRSGIDAGATVIVYPPAQVSDGVRVRVRQV